MTDKKMTVKVLIENDRVFTEEYNSNQKIQVIVNKALANLKIEAEGRELRNAKGEPIQDFTKTIEEANIYDNECLKFFIKSSKPDRDKRFA